MTTHHSEPAAPRAVEDRGNDHPCFDAGARTRTARVHLPVAPRCNVQCNYCDRRSDCVAESRPGVSSTVLTPEQAADYLDAVAARTPHLAVVGIAGPGDPFANSERTMATLRLCAERHPELMLCVATNGLGIGPHLDELADLGVSHVTVTMSTVDPEVGAGIYRWVRDGARIHRGVDGARLLMERQFAAIRGLKERGITVKINTILVPGLTLEAVADVARTAADLGADLMNCMPMYPVEGTPLAPRGTPDAFELVTARAAAGAHVAQMSHCQRCRADAVGTIDQAHTPETLARLEQAARAPIDAPRTDRPFIAATSMEGYLVNLHLGGADRVYIIEQGVSGSRLREIRALPTPGGGARRWEALAGTLSDCRALLVSQLGESPRAVLSRAGLRVYEVEGLITEITDGLFAGRVPVPRPPARGCGDCSGPGTGCG
jgi:nitrogen fixation protein NifB